MVFQFPMEVYSGYVRCPVCKAAPAQACRRLSSSGRRGQQTHPEREQAAALEGSAELAPGLTKSRAAAMWHALGALPGVRRREQVIAMERVVGSAVPEQTYARTLARLVGASA